MSKQRLKTIGRRSNLEDGIIGLKESASGETAAAASESCILAIDELEPAIRTQRRLQEFISNESSIKSVEDNGLQGRVEQQPTKDINRGSDYSINDQYLIFDENNVGEWTEKHYSSWHFNLEPKERDALEDYTGTAHSDINRFLRRYDKDSEEYIRDYIDYMSAALARYPIPSNIVVYRGASLRALEGLEYESPQKLVGKVLMDKGFMSTSLVNKLAFTGLVRFIIKVPKGTHGAYLGYISQYEHDEAEVLLDKGQQMVITDAVKDTNGQLQITCEII